MSLFCPEAFRRWLRLLDGCVCVFAPYHRSKDRFFLLTKVVRSYSHKKKKQPLSFRCTAPFRKWIPISVVPFARLSAFRFRVFRFASIDFHAASQHTFERALHTREFMPTDPVGLMQGSPFLPPCGAAYAQPEDSTDSGSDGARCRSVRRRLEQPWSPEWFGVRRSARAAVSAAPPSPGRRRRRPGEVRVDEAVPPLLLLPPSPPPLASGEASPRGPAAPALPVPGVAVRVVVFDDDTAAAVLGAPRGVPSAAAAGTQPPAASTRANEPGCPSTLAVPVVPFWDKPLHAEPPFSTEWAVFVDGLLAARQQQGL